MKTDLRPKLNLWNKNVDEMISLFQRDRMPAFGLNKRLSVMKRGSKHFARNDFRRQRSHGFA